MPFQTISLAMLSPDGPIFWELGKRVPPVWAQALAGADKDPAKKEAAERAKKRLESMTIERLVWGATTSGVDVFLREPPEAEGGKETGGHVRIPAPQALWTIDKAPRDEWAAEMEADDGVDFRSLIDPFTRGWSVHARVPNMGALIARIVSDAFGGATVYAQPTAAKSHELGLRFQFLPGASFVCTSSGVDLESWGELQARIEAEAEGDTEPDEPDDALGRELGQLDEEEEDEDAVPGMDGGANGVAPVAEATP
jgi:hypothetical protein